MVVKKINMKLSVIILCYNFEKFIEQCLLSVLSQRTKFDFEILIRDDFSSDKSASIIKRIAYYNSNITFIEGSENIGFAKGYKQLLDLSQGEYIAYTDGDDYWTDLYKLQKQCDFLDTNPDYVLTCTGYWQKDENENYSPLNPDVWLCPPIRDENMNIPSEHFLESNPAHYGKLYRNLPHFYDYMYELPLLDWPINFELSLLGKIKYLNYPTGVYRSHVLGLMTVLQSQSNIGTQIKEIFNKRLNEINN
jgi:glycosyltransferase involved in cell wall biosynthesis